ncbi:YihY/virulence factor BrkB family protein [Microbacterium sp. SYP-A9085]|nr:YihY/virulence factor BrkB family protein [Microbacterium sp. SYP-A9085]
MHDEQSLRERWDAAATGLRERFDEPISRASALTRRTLGWFPIRVWRHFLRSNGFLLAASISYQSLFAIFAVIYVAFATLGIWAGADPAITARMIALINRILPGVIGDPPAGLVSRDAVTAVASGGGSVLALTGAVALVVAGWTAIGFVTFTRRAVRVIFDLPFDARSYVLLKARDLLAAVLFGLAFLVGAAVGALAGGALDALFRLAGLPLQGTALTVKVLSVPVAFAINATALAGLFRFLSGTTLAWRRIWPGALLGGAAIAVLQLGLGFLVAYTPSNPLLATFSVLIAFLLWFRLIGIVILVAASWIAVWAQDRRIPLRVPSTAERLLAEHEALLLAAHIRLREARAARAVAGRFRRWRADRAVRAADEDLRRIEAARPSPAGPASLSVGGGG